MLKPFYNLCLRESLTLQMVPWEDLSDIKVVTWTEHFWWCQNPYCRLKVKCAITHSFSSRDVASVLGFDGMHKENASQVPWYSPSLFLPLLRALAPSLAPCLAPVSLQRRSKVPVSTFCFYSVHCPIFSPSLPVSVSPILCLCLFLSLMSSLSLETSRPQTSFHIFWLTGLCFSVRDTLWGSAVRVTHYSWILSEVLRGCHLLKSICNDIRKPFYFLHVMKFRIPNKTFNKKMCD